MAMLLYADKRLTSPYAMSAFVALTEKQIPFGVRTLDLAIGANNDPEYARTSLTQRVPTLIDGDFALSESSAIGEYLNDVYPDPPIFSTDPQKRARARQVQAWPRSDFMPIRWRNGNGLPFSNGFEENAPCPEGARVVRPAVLRRLSPHFRAVPAK